MRDLESLAVFGLTINKDKSRVIGNHPSVNERLKDQSKVLSDIEGVEVVAHHKYLGIELGTRKADF